MSPGVSLRPSTGEVTWIRTSVSRSRCRVRRPGSDIAGSPAPGRSIRRRSHNVRLQVRREGVIHSSGEAPAGNRLGGGSCSLYSGSPYRGAHRRCSASIRQRVNGDQGIKLPYVLAGPRLVNHKAAAHRKGRAYSTIIADDIAICKPNDPVATARVRWGRSFFRT